MVSDMYSLNSNKGFAIWSSVVDSANVYNVRSSEDTLLTGTHETFRPVLFIDYSYGTAVPEPASLAVLGLGGLMLVARGGSRRRRV
jgi:hypothetical protein